MGVWSRAARELRFLRGLRRVFTRIQSIDHASHDLVCDDWERAVDRWPDHVAVVFEDRKVTYRELDALANRFAHWAKGRGLRKGDTVAVVMPNRIEFLAVWLGLAKVGIVSALVNNNLSGAPLAHCLRISGAGHVIADTDTAEAVEQVRHQLTRSVMLWVLGLRTEDETSDRRGLDSPVRGASTVRPDRSIRADLTAADTVLYIFTSGTTGLPKAAKMTHARVQTYMRAFAGATDARETDVVYCALPLYHATGGLCGVGTAFMNGGTLVLRRKFSATGFWEDVVAHGCTMFVYIGELCRYLVNHPPGELEHKHKLRLAFGNGLRPDVWKTFQNRFGIPAILEFYGSTEGNVSLFNFDGRQGAVGRVPPYLRNRFNVRLVRFDLETETPVRGTDGLCQETRPGEIGEAIGEIRTEARFGYSGYADKAASEAKVLRDVFKAGDAWFRTGDLMRQDGDGYFYFVDRIGDTFRWKGENVSTTEVAERLAGAPGVVEVTVYGVPVAGADGKAGMAALTVGEHFDLETTGTFKYRKVDLAAEGFDPRKTGEPVWFRDPEKGYVKLTNKLYERLVSGDVRL